MPIKRGRSGGVCIYLRNYLSLKIPKIDNLQESVACELQSALRYVNFVLFIDP